MDKRFFLALLLTAIVIVGTPFLFPNSRRTPVRAVDSTQVHPRTDSGAPIGAAAPGNQAVVAAPVATAPAATCE